MKIDLYDRIILDLSGSPVEWRSEVLDPRTGDVKKPAVVLTAIMAIQQALGASYRDEESLSQQEKNKRFELGMRFNSTLPVEVSAEEQGEILKLVSKYWTGSVVYPRISQMFNSASQQSGDAPVEMAEAAAKKKASK
jgi:hypothetical protein